jgi:hypothetical protein
MTTSWHSGPTSSACASVRALAVAVWQVRSLLCPAGGHHATRINTSHADDGRAPWVESAGAFPNPTLAAHRVTLPLQFQFNIAQHFTTQLSGERSTMATYYSTPVISTKETTSLDEEELEAATC